MAGKRAGLEGQRSGLFFEIVRIVKEMRQSSGGLFPGFVVLENVPGLFSADGGRAFARVLAGLAESGALDIAWAVLDAQWFGVPQRRRRVFIVADFGGERAAEILALAEGGSRHPAKGREARARTAGAITPGANPGGESGRDAEAEGNLIAATMSSNGEAHSGFRCGDGQAVTATRHVAVERDSHMGMGGVDDNAAQAGHLVLQGSDDNGSNQVVTFPALSGGHGGGGGHQYRQKGNEDAVVITHSLRPEGADASEDGTGRGTPLIAFNSTAGSRSLDAGELSPPGGVGSGLGIPSPPAVAFKESQSGCREGRVHATLDANKGSRRQEGVHAGMMVRRLAPVECCRLQGFPDDWLDLDPPLSDSAKYRLLGNAVAVPCAEWLARRIVRAAP